MRLCWILPLKARRFWSPGLASPTFGLFLPSSRALFLGPESISPEKGCVFRSDSRLRMERTGVRYLLDTAPWINGVTLPAVLPQRIRRLIGNVEMKGLCSVSLLETSILYRLGRLQIDGALTQFFAVGLSADVQLLELTPVIAATANELPTDFPGDPFDRTIVATAAVLNLTLITADSAIRDADACAVEY